MAAHHQQVGVLGHLRQDSRRVAVHHPGLDRHVRVLLADLGDGLLQYWALDAFRDGDLTKEHGLTPEAGWEGAQAMRRLQEEGGGQHWSAVLAQAKELGDVRVHACSLSLDMLGLTKDDLDPMVDDVEGVTAFMLAADGQLVFI